MAFLGRLVTYEVTHVKKVVLPKLLDHVGRRDLVSIGLHVAQEFVAWAADGSALPLLLKIERPYALHSEG